MSLSKEERKAIVEFRIEKAFRAFNEANGDNAQTHSGVIHLFGLRFIKTGIFGSDMGKLFHSLFTMRQTGDYDDTYGLTEEDVLPNVKPTGEFIEKVVNLAKKYLDENQEI